MTFSTLSDFTSTNRVECGDLSHTQYLAQVSDKVVSLAVFDDEEEYGFGVSLNTSSFVPGSMEEGTSWDDTLIECTVSSTLESALKVVNRF